MSYPPVSDELPQYLQHRPFFALPYEHFDGSYSDDTDMRYVSVGLAQYDPGSISIKTLRHPGGKWSRQSEELPAHRVIDMTLWLALVLFRSREGKVLVKAHTFLNQEKDFTITQEQARTKGEQEIFRMCLNPSNPDYQITKGRLRVLADLLCELREEGKI